MYPFLQSDSSLNGFYFITDSGITFNVEFSDASNYFEEIYTLHHNVESISFSPIGRRPRKDNKIAPTICEIIKQRCISNNVAVVFVCDQTNEVSRSRLFGQWDKQLNDGSFHFIPAIIEYPGGEIHTGLIVSATNKDADLYISEFSIGMQTISEKFN